MRTYGATRWLGMWAATALLATLAFAACADDDGGDGDADGGSSEGSAGDGAGGRGSGDGGGQGEAGDGAGGDGAGGSGEQDAGGHVEHDGGTAEDAGPASDCDCGDAPSACVEFECVDGTCEERDVDDGEPIDEQTEGDCEVVVCDGEGGTRSEPEAERTACDEDGGVMCDDAGACVECTDQDDCTGGDVCQSGACVPEECMNGDQDGDETDEDCGGGECAPCGPDFMCVEASDCAGGDCGGSDTCVPNCSDGVQNGDEAGEDCGEGCPSGCPAGTACDEPADCESGICDPGSDQCDLSPCEDGEQNNDEVDVDCGPGCDPCGNDMDCTEDEHCTSGICIGGTCDDMNGCTRGAAMNLTSMSSVTITLNGPSHRYEPNCIRVSAGTVVHISDSNNTHPFTGGRIVGTAKQPTASGPFAGGPFTSGALMFTMGSAGEFGFYCNVHGPSGMKGAVLVE